MSGGKPGDEHRPSGLNSFAGFWQSPFGLEIDSGPFIYLGAVGAEFHWHKPSSDSVPWPRIPLGQSTALELRCINGKALKKGHWAFELNNGCPFSNKVPAFSLRRGPFKIKVPTKKGPFFPWTLEVWVV